MAKFRHFELNEFIVSDTAKKKGIDNTPTFEVVEHLIELVETILEPLRTDWGDPLDVKSGFRCPALNKAVGGKDSSAHPYGWAADIQPRGPMSVFKAFVVDWFNKHPNIKFDQLLLEKNKDGDEWVHIGLKNKNGLQRRQIKIINA